MTVLEEGTISPTRALIRRPPSPGLAHGATCPASSPSRLALPVGRSPGARHGGRRQLQQIERVVLDHPLHAFLADARFVDRLGERPAVHSAGIGLWRWPASLIRMQRSGPSALIASTWRASGAWFHIGDTVQ